MPQPTPFSSETLSGVSSSELITLANGRLVAFWLDGNVRGQLLDSTGIPVGAAFTVNTVTAGDQGWDIGRVAAPLDGGGFVVVWSDPFSFDAPATVKAQMFASNGVKIGGEITVGSGDVLFQDFSVTGLNGGGFAVSWDTTNTTTFETDTFVRVFDSAGAPLGDRFAAPGGAVGSEDFPAIAQLGNGNIVIAYSDNDANTTSGVATTSGVVQSASLWTISNAFVTDVAALAGGGFVLVYETLDGGPSIAAQRFDEAGDTVGAAITISTSAVAPDDARVTALADGGFFVAWDDEIALGETEINGARFTAAGAPDGGLFLIAEGGALDLQSVGAIADGRIAVTWVNETAGETIVATLDPRAGGITLSGLALADDWRGTEFFDVLNGGDGNDVIGGGGGGDVLTGGAGNDTLRGDAGFDVLTGNEGSDVLDGGNGVDVMDGGVGNDTYVVDTTADAIVDASGRDLVQASLSWTLAVGLEYLTLLGGADIDATGNSVANTITGNSGANVLNGLLGPDTMIGGAGDDTYVVDNVRDVTTEVPDGGNDTVRSNVTRTLGANLENLTFYGARVVNGTGNTLANTITGNGSANRLDGAGGNDTLSGGGAADTLIGGNGDDTLNGGTGNDTMTGGAGVDRFVFNTAPSATNRDTITDYSAPADTIVIENNVFVGVGGVGVLTAQRFRIGSTAADSSDRIIYDSATGALYFDADGDGAGAQTQFATLAPGLALSAGDFEII